MIVVITMINYIDRGAISYAAESITREYGLDRVAWGTVLGYFGYGYMFGALLGGTFADVWGPKRVWLVAGFAWSFFEGATAFAGDLGLALFGGLIWLSLRQRLIEEIQATRDDPVLLEVLFLRANEICNATHNARLADERAERFANAF